jgi:hypothetical protein
LSAWLGHQTQELPEWQQELLARISDDQVDETEEMFTAGELSRLKNFYNKESSVPWHDRRHGLNNQEHQLIEEISQTDQEAKRMDGSYNNETIEHEPAQAGMHSNFPSISWKFNPLDKQFSTQMEGLEPSEEEPTEVHETPEENPKKLNTQATRQKEPTWEEQVVTDVTMDPTKATETLRNLFSECHHWDLTCWENTMEEWDEHQQQCYNHPYNCLKCGHNSREYLKELRRVSIRTVGDDVHAECWD